MILRFAAAWVLALLVTATAIAAEPIQVTEDENGITIETAHVQALIRKHGYVSGVAGGTFLDKKTGAVDLGFGLDIVDWIMEPGSDEAYRDRLPEEMIYRYGNAYHGDTPKRSLEGPQICTKARRLEPELIRGDDFVAVKLSFQYQTSAPGKKQGSVWTQTLVFPAHTRYFLSSDHIQTVNSSDAMFLRIDMPGHIKHQAGDRFSQIYLSYLPQTAPAEAFEGGLIPSDQFTEDFPPDARFNYRRDRVEAEGQPLPSRFIRAYRIREPSSRQEGPWLAGMTLDPSVVYEAWCHQRGYVCMIEEFGGRPIQPGGSFSAAFIVGYFDSLDEMHQVYDAHRGFTGLQVGPDGWQLTRPQP